MGCEAKVETVHVTSENLLMTSDDGFRTEFELAMINEDYALAEKIAKSQTNALPNDSRAWLQLAYPLMMLKQYDEASKVCETALTLSPSSIHVHYTKGLVSQKHAESLVANDKLETADQHYRRAIDSFNSCLKIDQTIVSHQPLYAAAHFGLAAAYEGLGTDDSRVVFHANRYLDLYPDSPIRDEALDMIKLAKSYLCESP